MTSAIPVVDLFAGPGGLGEGFTALELGGAPGFDVRLSIEKDPVACATLRLRKFVRAFKTPPPEYWGYLAGALSLEELFHRYPREGNLAITRTWQAELGRISQALVYRRVRAALGSTTSWVLIGGPPCQAYSLVGRARMKHRSDFEDDERHFLYREYLRIVANQHPTVFVMENVKGLLSAKHSGHGMFDRICADLRQPGRAARMTRAYGIEYELYTLAATDEPDLYEEDADSFLVRAEDYGIPQSRHRVFIVGVLKTGHRSSLKPERLQRRPLVTARDAIGDLPRLRSRLSGELDSQDAWVNVIEQIQVQDWFRLNNESSLADVVKVARASLSANRWPLHTNNAVYRQASSTDALKSWYRTGAVGLTMHESRSHMRSDLWRYFFCACFAASRGRSPSLRDFPHELIPNHRNALDSIRSGKFVDRFSVQMPDRPSSTVVSHIAKDGHYYIHYDPTQCRSLSPREAARLQTFPDNYFFEGKRTEQFHQIGNAVPPLLAREIARIVRKLMTKLAN